MIAPALRARLRKFTDSSRYRGCDPRSEKEVTMTTVSHEPAARARRSAWIDARDMWASLAIAVIWLAVSLTAVFGPDLRSIDVSGNSTTVPSGMVVAFFALFATMSVAKHGFDK